MFSSNIIKKFIGFAKEVILASVFGSHYYMLISF